MAVSDILDPGQDVDVLICPSCHGMVGINKQRQSDDLYKKKNHQMHMSDLVWHVFLEEKGESRCKTMEDFLTQLLFEHKQRKQQRGLINMNHDDPLNLMVKSEPRVRIMGPEPKRKTRLHIGNPPEQEPAK